jgi:hypothetical protein
MARRSSASSSRRLRSEFSTLADPKNQLPDFVNFGRGFEDDFILAFAVKPVVYYGAQKEDCDQVRTERPSKGQEKET